MESCVKTKTESLLEEEKHKQEIFDLKNIIAEIRKDLIIKTQRERQLAQRLEALRQVLLDKKYHVLLYPRRLGEIGSTFKL